MARGEMNQDPVQDDYFNTDALDSYSDALVREAIQNSLDAKVADADDPIRVRITFPDDSNLPDVEDAAPYLDSLWTHIKATDVVTEIPESDGKVPFLLFEDFGTRGLVGDPELSEDPEDGELADFFYFWRNVGRGKKKGDERGRWGLGKTMFPASSRIHAFFGLTLRDGDENALLMGQSKLSIHRIGGNKHYPYGYYADHDPDDQFALPITDKQRIDDFSQRFKISRKSETGLSVVVPYPRMEIEATDVLKSVVKHYFYPILSGSLIVEVVSKGSHVCVKADTIDDVVRDHFSDDDKTFRGTLTLAKWHISATDEKTVEAKLQKPYRRPIWEPDLFTIGEIDHLADVLDDFKPVRVRIPVHIIPSGSQPTLSHFYVILQRDSELERPLDMFIRAGITITGVTSLRDSGIRALVIAEDLPISTMLGDSENPAHTEWQYRSRNFVGKYRVGKSTLAFVKDAPRGLLRILNKRSEQIDHTALRHLFPDPSSIGGKPVTTPSPEPKPGPKPGPDIVIDVEPRPRIFKMSRTSGGFSASLTPAGQQMVPMSVRVRLAYDVRRGNPYKRWNAADFDFSQEHEQITHSGGDLLQVVGNKLEIRATSPEWKLQISGFDPDRDLIVDIRREAS